VLPSRALQYHPQRCGSPGRKDITIPATVHPATFRQLHPRTSIRTATRAGGTHTATLEAALGQAQDSPRRPLGARFVRTTTNSTALYAILPYVALELYDTIVNRLPLAYKRRRRSPGRGGTTVSCALARFPPSPRHWHFASNKPQGPGGFASSPTTLVAPSVSTTMQRNTVPRAQPCWTYDPRLEPG
jgi:hypothetical protein